MNVGRPRTYYVYTYAYPSGPVFYVGKGCKGRIDDHEREAESQCECERCSIIREIWASGKPVQKRIVYESLVSSEALAFEKDCIERVYAGPDLTNYVHNKPVQMPAKAHLAIDEEAQRKQEQQRRRRLAVKEAIRIFESQKEAARHKLYCPY